MKTNCEIRFGFFDVSAKEDAALASSGGQSWANLGQLHDDTQKIGSWATLEPGNWPLDGSRDILPDDLTTAFLGLWSQAQTDDAGAFSAAPWVDVTFTQPHSSLGVTLTFSVATGEWASSVTIQWYNAAGAILKEKTYQPDGGVYFCAGKVENYRRVKLSFHGTNIPHHFLKLTGIQYGVLKVFDEKTLLSAKLVEEVDPLSDQLTINTLDFSAYAKEFDLLDMPEAYAMFQQRQEAKTLCTVDGVQSDYGTYYLDKPITQDDQVNMSCIGLLGVIDATDYAGGAWPSGITADALVSSILTSAGFPGQYELDTALSAVTLTGYVEACTHREALQQVAFALCAVVSCARSDKIRIFKVPSSVQATITTVDKVTGHTISQEPLITGVEVYTRQQGADDDTLTGSVYAEILPANAKANVKKVEGITLVSNAQSLAQHIYDWYQQRLMDEGSLFPGAWEPGEKVRLLTASGKALAGLITSMNTDLYDGMISKAVIRGSAEVAT